MTPKGTKVGDNYLTEFRKSGSNSESKSIIRRRHLHLLLVSYVHWNLNLIRVEFESKIDGYRENNLGEMYWTNEAGTVRGLTSKMSALRWTEDR